MGAEAAARIRADGDRKLVTSPADRAGRYETDETDATGQVGQRASRLCGGAAVPDGGHRFSCVDGGCDNCHQRLCRCLSY